MCLIYCLWYNIVAEPEPVTVYDALRSPSVRAAGTSFERRVALAVHEAKQGFRECPACGFTNAMRAVSCVRCSASLIQVTVLMKVRALVAGKSLPKSVNSSTTQSGDSRTQQRIRRRLEWTRQANDKCTLVWHHDHTLCDPELADYPAYVLQCHSEATPYSTNEHEPASPVSVSPTIPVDGQESSENFDNTHEMNAIDAVIAHLNARFEANAAAITNAMDANASHIAYAVSPAICEASTPLQAHIPTITITIVNATNALLPFPTKLAQFITSMAGIVGATSVIADTAASRLNLARGNLLQDSMVYLATIPPALARANIRVDFLGDPGIDAGGVYREWFLLLNEAIVKPEAGIFTCVNAQDQTFYLNPHSSEVLGGHHLAHFLAAGRLLGRALLDGNVTGFHLALPLLKIILGQPVGFGDLQYFDPEVYQHLKWLLDNDGVDALYLDFTVTEKLPDGSTRTVELVSGGTDVEVTDANKVEFVDAKLKYLLFESVKDQLFAFLTGIYEVVPAESLAIFDAEELDYVISGSDEIDVDDWEANTVASNNLMIHPSLEYFWKAVRELSPAERQLLLQFATGSSRVPPGGFCALASTDGKLCLFNLRGVEPKKTHGYLHSHACFNRLDVPRHASIRLMREAVRAAITSESIGFTTS